MSIKKKKKNIKSLSFDEQLKNAVIQPLDMKWFLEVCEKANNEPIEPELMKILEALSKH